MCGCIKSRVTFSNYSQVSKTPDAQQLCCFSNSVDRAFALEAGCHMCSNSVRDSKVFVRAAMNQRGYS